MSALIPPKHDLRGGNASADSFATYKIVFARSMSLCPVAAGNQWAGTAVKVGNRTRSWRDPRLV